MELFRHCAKIMQHDYSIQ